jgi:hypothetical protein
MCHVVQWLNTHPSKIGDRENNKPPLWREFVTPLRARFGDRAEVQSRELQRQIFNIVRDRIDELTKGNAGSYLSKLPSEEGEAYLERFGSPIWKDILVATHSIVGPNFQGPLRRFNTQDPKSLPSQAESTTLVQAIDQAIRRMPEITCNPAFHNSVALEALMSQISPLITDWASKQCGEALAAQNLSQATCWPPPVLEAMQSQCGKQEPPPVAQRTPLWKSSNIAVSLAQGEDLPQGPQVRSVGAPDSIRGDRGQDYGMAVLAKASPIVVDLELHKVGPSAQGQRARHDPLSLKQKPKSICQRDQPLPAQQGTGQISTGAPSPNLPKPTRSWKQGPKARAGSSQQLVRAAAGKHG